MARTVLFTMMLQAGLQRLQAAADPDRFFWLGNLRAAEMIRAIEQRAADPGALGRAFPWQN